MDSRERPREGKPADAIRKLAKRLGLFRDTVRDEDAQLIEDLGALRRHLPTVSDSSGDSSTGSLRAGTSFTRPTAQGLQDAYEGRGSFPGGNQTGDKDIVPRSHRANPDALRRALYGERGSSDGRNSLNVVPDTDHISPGALRALNEARRRRGLSEYSPNEAPNSGSINWLDRVNNPGSSGNIPPRWRERQRIAADIFGSLEVPAMLREINDQIWKRTAVLSSLKGDAYDSRDPYFCYSLVGEVQSIDLMVRAMRKSATGIYNDEGYSGHVSEVWENVAIGEPKYISHHKGWFTHLIFTDYATPWYLEFDEASGHDICDTDFGTTPRKIPFNGHEKEALEMVYTEAGRRLIDFARKNRLVYPGTPYPPISKEYADRLYKEKGVGRTWERIVRG